jgi:hypothetical protein
MYQHSAWPAVGNGLTLFGLACSCCRQSEEVADPVSGTPTFLTSTNQRQVVLGVRQVEVS